MTTIQKSVAALIGVVVILAIYGAYQYPAPTPQLAGTTPQGGTTSTAHLYSVAMNLAAPGVNATSSSILNSSPNDYYVTSIKVGCENLGVGSANKPSLTLSVATSSTIAPPTNSNANVVGGGTVPIGTSTAQYAVATSTIPAATSTGLGSSAPYIIWGAGTYMTFTFDATNTAVCTPGVEAFSS